MTSVATASNRNRALYILGTAAVMVLGLLSRRYQGVLPSFLGKYPGDSLWTLMVFFAWGALLPRASTLSVALLSIGTSYLIETLKLYQSPWLVSIRHSTLGHLVFGHTFSWHNLIAYLVGTALGIVSELILIRNSVRRIS